MEREFLSIAASGARQNKVLQSLILNWDSVEKAIRESSNSTGSIYRENEKYLNSIEGLTNRVTTAFQQLAKNTIDSGIIKFFLMATENLLKYTDAVGLLNVGLAFLVTTLFKQLTLTIPGVSMAFARLALNVGLAGTGVATFTTALSGLVASAVIIGAIFAFKELNKSIVDVANELSVSTEQFKENKKELDGLIAEYEELAKKERLSSEDKDRLLEIQILLNDKYATATENTDLYTAAINNNTDAIQDNIKWAQALSDQQAKLYLAENRQKYEQAQKTLDESIPGFFVGAVTGIREKGTREELVSDIEKAITVYYEANKAFIPRLSEWRAKLLEEIDAAKGAVTEYEAIASSLDHVGSAAKDALQEQMGMVAAIQDLGVALEESAPDVDFSKLGDSIKEQSSIIENYIENQALSLEEVAKLKELYGDDYLQFVSEENGLLQLNVDALKAKIDATLAEASATALRNGQEEEAAMIDAYRLQLMRQFAAKAQEVADKIAEENKKAAEESRKAWEDAVKDQQQAYQELLKATISMLRQEKEEEKDNLKEQLDGYKAIIDARKELLDQQKKERDYQKKTQNLNVEIGDIQAEIAELQFDTSEEAMKRRLELQAQLAEKQSDLEDTQYDHSVETQKDALDTEYENFAAGIEVRMKAIEDYLSRTGEITAEAMRLLDSQSSGFYQSLLEWNRIYGTGVDRDIVGAWQRAFVAIGKYENRTINAMNNMAGAQIAAQEMLVNYYLALKERVGDYFGGGGFGLGYGGDFGGGGVQQYHSGGMVEGGDQYGETYAKLMQGEVVTTPSQMKNFIQQTMPRLAESVGQLANSISIDMPISVGGNLDRSVLPEMKEMILDTLNKAMKQRGFVRNATSFSI